MIGQIEQNMFSTLRVSRLYTVLLLLTVLISAASAQSNNSAADASCAGYNTCSTCIHDGGLCGWCSTTQTCYSGTQYQPTTPSDCPVSSHWYGITCPATGNTAGTTTYDCSKFTSCGQCTSAQQCGWCASSNTCMSGDSVTAASGTCNAWAATSSECNWSPAYTPPCTQYDMVTTDNLGLPVRVRVTAYPTDSTRGIQSVQLSVVQNAQNPYTGNIRGIFFNINNVEWLHEVDLGSDITFSTTAAPAVTLQRTNDADEFYTTQLDDTLYGQAISLTRAVPEGNDFDIALTVGNGTFAVTSLFVNMSTLQTSSTIGRPLQLSDLGLFSVVVHNVGTSNSWNNNYGIAMVATMNQCVSNGDSVAGSSASEVNPLYTNVTDFCNLYEYCSDCVGDYYNACGWCSITSTCISGNKAGPTNLTQCGLSQYMYGSNVCPTSVPLFAGSISYDDGTCSTLSNCYDCTNAAACGWCSSSNTCMSGSSTTSADNTCSGTQWTYSGEQCPLPLAYVPSCTQYYMTTDSSSSTPVSVYVEVTANSDVITVTLTLDSSSAVSDNIRGIFFNVNNQNWLIAAILNTSIILNKLSPLPAHELYPSYTALFTSAVHDGITLTRDIPTCSGYDIGLNVGSDTEQITSIQLNITTVPHGADATLPLQLSQLGLFSVRTNQLDDTTRTHSALVTQFAGCVGSTSTSAADTGYVSLLGEISCNVTQSHCQEYGVCSDCNDDTACGWCGGTGKCLPGNAAGPSSGTCPLTTWAYEFDTCALLTNKTCGGYSTCSACALDPVCGWCSSTNTCMEGHTYPLFGAICSATYATTPDTCPYYAVDTPNCALYNLNSYVGDPALRVQVEINDIDNNVLPVTFTIVPSATSTNTGNLRAVYFDLNNEAYKQAFDASYVTVSAVHTVGNSTTYTPISIPPITRFTNTLVDAYSNTTNMTLIPAVSSRTVFDIAIQLSNLTDTVTAIQLNFSAVDNLQPDQFAQFYVEANNIQQDVNSTTQVTVMDTCQRQLDVVSVSAFAFITDPSIEPYFGLFWAGVGIVLVGAGVGSYYGYKRYQRYKAEKPIVDAVTAPVEEFVDDATEESRIDSVVPSTNAFMSADYVDSAGDEFVYVQNRLFTEVTDDKQDGVQQYQAGDTDANARTYAAPAHGVEADDVVVVRNRVDELDAQSYNLSNTTSDEAAAPQSNNEHRV